MAAHTCNPAAQAYRQEWNRPDDQLDPAGIIPVRKMLCPPVSCPEPPGKRDGGKNDGYHDRKHDPGRVEQDLLFLGANRSDGIEDAAASGGQQGNCARQGRSGSKDSHHKVTPNFNPSTPTSCESLRPPGL